VRILSDNSIHTCFMEAQDISKMSGNEHYIYQSDWNKKMLS